MRIFSPLVYSLGSISLAEIYRALAFVREQDESLSFGRDRELAELMEQVSGLLPTDALRQRDAPERGTMTMK